MKFFKLVLISLSFLGLTILNSSNLLAANVFSSCSSNSKLSSTNICKSISNNNSTGNPINNIIDSILGVITYIAGILAVILILVSGYRFVTSGGNPNAITQARQTLMYALIGIIVVAVSQSLILFIFSKVTIG